MATSSNRASGSRFAGLRRDAEQTQQSAAQSNDYVPSEYWINVGVMQPFTNERGETEVIFVPLNKGIPLDSVKEADESRAGLIGAINQASNRLLADLRNHPDVLALEPGQNVLVDEGEVLAIQIQRVKDKSVSTFNAEENPLIPKGGFFARK